MGTCDVFPSERSARCRLAVRTVPALSSFLRALPRFFAGVFDCRRLGEDFTELALFFVPVPCGGGVFFCLLLLLLLLVLGAVCVACTISVSLVTSPAASSVGSFPAVTTGLGGKPCNTAKETTQRGPCHQTT